MIRFWARTNCKGTVNQDFHCETGDCGPWIECSTGIISHYLKPWLWMSNVSRQHPQRRSASCVTGRVYTEPEHPGLLWHQPGGRVQPSHDHPRGDLRQLSAQPWPILVQFSWVFVWHQFSMSTRALTIWSKVGIQKFSFYKYSYSAVPVYKSCTAIFWSRHLMVFPINNSQSVYYTIFEKFN